LLGSFASTFHRSGVFLASLQKIPTLSELNSTTAGRKRTPAPNLDLSFAGIDR